MKSHQKNSLKKNSPEEKSLKGGGVYAITASNLPATLLIEKTEALLNAGIALLQYRNKAATASYNRQVIPALLLRCQQAQIPLIINDDIALAVQYGADGVHLGQGDGSIAEAKAALPANAIIGRTCHNSLALAQAAQSEGASYVAFGAFYPSATKPNAQRADINTLEQAAKLDIPIVAIGGITAQNGQEIINAGAHYLAVCSEIFSHPNAQKNAQALTALDFSSPFERA